ncbi:MAG: tetratricopeptide repeat protein [Paludisphaera borealis]|uniref:tetratricopeptide repeat protein n=1 Tax=Paludisphaera borealis TaxID=1387353 RepID=UPI0028489E5E|nr:tetratricopeptide repeat protein [Paludisphaera borealis]MDR3623038.1 tetratricopeptide repeat protein [Paludisphaera borealis]
MHRSSIRQSVSRVKRFSEVVAAAIVWLAASGTAHAADLEEATSLYRTGQYDEAAKQAAEAVGRGAATENWYALKIQSEMTRGKYSEAGASLNEATRRFPASLTLFLLGREVRRFNPQTEGEEAANNLIERIVINAPQRYGTLEGQLALGRFFLRRGADPKKVLDRFYDPLMKKEPEFADPFFAAAELALDKQDYALAAETLRQAPKHAAEDPRFHYLRALAFAQDDRAASTKALAEALKINPRYVDALLLKADDQIDAEQYADAAKTLDQALEVNPQEPRGWAYRAVLAHLRNDAEGETRARKSALAPWAGNPEVDTLIGRKLSEKYRFAEGAAALKQAVALDPSYLPAKVQLSQTLLRLGDEAEGWKLVEEIVAKDAYNVVAFNLTTLRDRLAQFRTIEEDGIVLRMDPREAELYGARVLDLLKRAKTELSAKYGVAPPNPIIVEIFPRKQEFAVRTFGLPGADGLLGVCFGRVVTANSPASQGEHPSNGESVLWHELCHVVTLTKTHNKMPRWLSEGISVYEEGLKDPAWGSAMTPRLRSMLVGDELTPLSRLSSAFLAPKTAQHVQFAYFESAMAVEFLVQKAGLPALNGLLEDLGAGKNLDDVLPTRTKMTLEQLDKEFAQFARGKAATAAPEATWEEIDLPDDADSAAVTAWLETRPKSFRGWQRLATRLVAERKWPEAKAALLKFQALFPDYVGPENAYIMLAAVHKHSADAAAEHAVLEELAQRDGDAIPAYQRLMELDEAAGDWAGVARNANRFLAVNPLVPEPYRRLARAAERLDRRDEAITSYRALATLDDTDPAEVHFRLAKLLHQAGKRDEARREVLKSLEEAPRFLESHRLLLELVDADAVKPPPGPASAPTPRPSR